MICGVLAVEVGHDLWGADRGHAHFRERGGTYRDTLEKIRINYDIILSRFIIKTKL